MFLIIIKKAADQGTTCKDSLDIDLTVRFYVPLALLLLMFVSVLVYFLASHFSVKFTQCIPS